MGGDLSMLKTVGINGDFRYGCEVPLGEPLKPARKPARE